MLKNDHVAPISAVETILLAGGLLSADDIQKRQATDPVPGLDAAGDWKRRGLIFSVPHQGRDYYPAYQFDVSGRPLPVIQDILSAYGPHADPWGLASWFHFPNGWIVEHGPHGAVPVAPKDALGRPADVIKAAQNHRGTYVA